MPKVKDMTNETHGRLKVISTNGKAKNGDQKWLCQCECGGFITVQRSDLLSRNTQSCGCLQKETRIKSHTIHGDSANPKRLYRIWRGMKTRCLNANSKRFNDYGGRGIAIHHDWVESYLNFRKWAMSNGYQDNLSIDRINNDGNYEPENCRWATLKEQNNNQRPRKSKYILCI